MKRVKVRALRALCGSRLCNPSSVQIRGPARPRALCGACVTVDLLLPLAALPGAPLSFPWSRLPPHLPSERILQTDGLSPGRRRQTPDPCVLEGKKD